MEAPVGVEYSGPSGVGRDSPWLTSEDLVEGTDAKVKIARVIKYPEVKFQDGKVRKDLIGLEFVGKTRVLGLNSTNRKIMNAMFTNITKSWKGQEIALYVTDTQAFGQTVKCVRIRNTKGRTATAAESFLIDEEKGNDDPKAAPIGREPGDDD